MAKREWVFDNPKSFRLIGFDCVMPVEKLRGIKITIDGSDDKFLPVCTNDLCQEVRFQMEWDTDVSHKVVRVYRWNLKVPTEWFQQQRSCLTIENDTDENVFPVVAKHEFEGDGWWSECTEEELARFEKKKQASGELTKSAAKRGGPGVFKMSA